MYHILFNANENYIKYLAAVVSSVVFFIDKSKPFAEREQLHFHVLHDGLSETTAAKIKELEEQLNAVVPVSIHCYQVDDRWLAECPKWHGSYVAYFRVLFDQFLPEDAQKVLYLDSDTLVLKDIREIFNIDLENNVLGAVYENQTYTLQSYDKKSFYTVNQGINYFNSGVMIIDRQKWVENGVEEKTKAFLKTYEVKSADQDALNAVLEDKVLLLPYKWNMKWGRSLHPDQRYFIAEYYAQVSKEQEKWFYEGFENPSIVHFSIRPWASDGFFLSRAEKKYYYYPFINEWWSIAERTPVFSEELLSIRKSSQYKRMILLHGFIKTMLDYPWFVFLLKFNEKIKGYSRKIEKPIKQLRNKFRTWKKRNF